MLYKLTDAHGCTRFRVDVLQWGEGVTNTCARPNDPPSLCSGTVIHAYESALVAMLMDPTNGQYLPNGRLWEAEGVVAVRDLVKCGVRELTTTREIPLPVITMAQRVEVAMRCSLITDHDPTWVAWANGWLNGNIRLDARITSSYAARATWAAAVELDNANRVAAAAALANESAEQMPLTSYLISHSSKWTNNMKVLWATKLIGFNSADAIHNAAYIAACNSIPFDLHSIIAGVIGVTP